MKQRPHFEEKHILAIFIYPPPLQGGENANRGGGENISNRERFDTSVFAGQS